jgi:hypothetical protein
MKQKIRISIVAGALALALNVRATQSGATHHISGSYVDFSGMPPTEPGFYLLNYFLDYDHGQFSGGKDLPFGGVFAAGVTVNSQAEVPMGIYAYPFSFQNITFSSGIAVPFVWMNVKASATYNRNGNQISAGAEQSVSGLGDIQLMPIMAGWTNGDFRVSGLFNIFAPTGDYTTGQLANQGLGYWTFEPMLACTWLSSKIGTEFSAFAGLDFNTENTDASYQSGDIFHLDATLAQHLPLFGGIVGAGASAFYLKQITDDSNKSGSLINLGGFEAESYGVGPTISYVHPIGKSTLVADGSWLPQLHTENTLKGNLFWVKLTLAF